MKKTIKIVSVFVFPMVKSPLFLSVLTVIISHLWESRFLETEETDTGIYERR